MLAGRLPSPGADWSPGPAVHNTLAAAAAECENSEIDTILGRRRGDDTISQSEARDAHRGPIRIREMSADIPGNANLGDKGSGAVTTSQI